MLAGLIDQRRSYELRGLELTDREAIQPGLLATREAVDLRASHVPQLDIHAVRPALAKEQNGHDSRV